MKSREEIERELATAVSNILENNIIAKGRASLVVSGGSTPKNLFEKLSNIQIQWDKVDIVFADERFVPDNHQDQNGTLLKTHLLKNFAATANYISLVNDINDANNNLYKARELSSKIPRPFTIVILGMGTDGHTASLFPDSDELHIGMDLATTDELIISNSKTAPYERITFTRKALLNTNNLFLHCYGSEKKEILDQISTLNDYLPYPIQGFINQSKVRIELFWAN